MCLSLCPQIKRHPNSRTSQQPENSKLECESHQWRKEGDHIRDHWKGICHNIDLEFNPHEGWRKGERSDVDGQREITSPDEREAKGGGKRTADRSDRQTSCESDSRSRLGWNKGKASRVPLASGATKDDRVLNSATKLAGSRNLDPD